MTKAMAHFPNVTPRNVVLLSLGSGSFPRHASVFKTKNGLTAGGQPELWRADWGVSQWMPFLLDILLDGDSITIEMVMHYLLGSSGMYHRLDPRLPRQIKMDDLTAIPEILEFAENVNMETTFNFVDNNFSFDDLSSADDTMVFNSLDSAASYHDAWASYHKSLETVIIRRRIGTFS
eukprot:gene1455-2799_t